MNKPQLINLEINRHYLGFPLANGKNLRKDILKLIPLLNGKPIIMNRLNDLNGIRIIFSNGTVEYQPDHCIHPESFTHGCTSRSTQLKAVIACILYDIDILQLENEERIKEYKPEFYTF